jgi:hypothetical protein
MSDRIIVIAQGRIAATLNRGEATQEKILEYAAEVDTNGDNHENNSNSEEKDVVA